MRKYGRKLLTLYGVSFIVLSALGLSFIVTHTEAIFELVASSITSFSGATTTVFFRPYGETTLQTGDMANIDINVYSKVAIDALGATVSFATDTLEIVGVSKANSFFDLWTEDTSISEGDGLIHFSGGTTRRGGIMGTGTVLTLLVRAKKSGSAPLDFKEVQVYPSNDTGIALETATHGISYSIHQAPPIGVISPSGASISAASPPPPTGDLNGDGKVTLADFSILTFKMLMGYNPRFDLNLNGGVGLDDLSILLSQI